MATSLALALLLLAQGQPPQTQTAPATPVQADPGMTTFTDAALGLSFAHPTTWTTVATPVPVAPKTKGNRFKLPGGKKPEKKPDDGMVTFRIPGANGAAPSELTIVHASFSDAPEKWQQIQADTNRNQKREVERQWQQEILSVPLLLTRISYDQNGTPTTTVTGLLYNAAPYKLLFRLTGPTAGFDGAQYQFTQAMETLRTTSDTLPSAQEPGKPITPPVVPGPDAKHAIFGKTKVPPQQAPLSLPVTVGTRKMVLRVPEGWTLDKVDADSAVLRNPEVKDGVTVKLYASATAARPADALNAAANKTLEEYKTVDLREDTTGEPNKAGNPMLAVWRKGTAAKGPYATLDAVVVAGDYYMLFALHPSPGEDLNHERKVVQAMLDAVGLEPAP